MPERSRLRIAAVLAAALAGGLRCSGGGAQDEPPPPEPAVRLPRTGQAVSADPAGAGRDDGALRVGVAWPSPRFTDGGDGTVQDALTGLAWLKDANCMKTQAPWLDTDGTSGDGAVKLPQAIAFAESLPIPGCGGAHDDWRLPNLLELQSLFDYSSVGFMLAQAGFSTVQMGYPGYWTSTGESGSGWDLSINVENGIVQMSWPSASEAYVWPVRGGLPAAPAALPKTGQRTTRLGGDDGAYTGGVAWPSPRFVPGTDGTVRDALTGLVWPAHGDVVGQVTWPDALDRVAQLNAQQFLGHADWRLPNVNELGSLYHYGYAEETCGASPCSSAAAWLATQGFTNVQSLLEYWSSTSWALGPSQYARVLHSYSAKSGVLHVWPVRGGQ